MYPRPESKPAPKYDEFLTHTFLHTTNKWTGVKTQPSWLEGYHYQFLILIQISLLLYIWYKFLKLEESQHYSDFFFFFLQLEFKQTKQCRGFFSTGIKETIDMWCWRCNTQLLLCLVHLLWHYNQSIQIPSYYNQHKCLLLMFTSADGKGHFLETSRLEAKTSSTRADIWFDFWCFSFCPCAVDIPSTPSVKISYCKQKITRFFFSLYLGWI